MCYLLQHKYLYNGVNMFKAALIVFLSFLLGSFIVAYFHLIGNNILAAYLGSCGFLFWLFSKD